MMLLLLDAKVRVMWRLARNCICQSNKPLHPKYFTLPQQPHFEIEVISTNFGLSYRKVSVVLLPLSNNPELLAFYNLVSFLNSSSIQISLIFLACDVIYLMSPQYCVVHPYCARFSRHQRTQMSACTYTTKETSLKLSSKAK